MERMLRAALAATLSILLVAGASLALTQAGPDDLATLQAAPWTLSELDGQSVPAEAGVTASFGADGSLTGFAGCNKYTGDYTVDGAILTVSPLASTRKACEPDVMDVENLFLDLMQAAAAWSLDGATLTVTTSDGAAIVFGGEDTGEPAPFTGTEWALTSITGEPVDAGMGVTAVFAEDFTVAGFAGCNQYSGGYAIDQGSIAIGPLAATRKACEQDVMDVENAFLNGMEQVSTLSIAGDTMTLGADDGSVELVFSAGGGASLAGTLEGVEWTLTDLDGTPAVAEDGMTVTFGQDSKIFGFGGCNDLFGGYSVDGSALVVEGLAATRKFCDPELMDREAAYMLALSDATEWQIDGESLTLATSDGGSLLFGSGGGTVSPTPGPVETMAPPADVSLVGPTWQLSELEGQEIPAAIISVTLSFAADGTLTGNGGCNDLTGEYSVDGDSITLSGIEGGTKVCDDGSSGVEQGLLQILPFVDTFSIVDGDLHLDSSVGFGTVWTAK
jgi:heat shock protein HslJ